MDLYTTFSHPRPQKGHTQSSVVLPVSTLHRFSKGIAITLSRRQSIGSQPNQSSGQTDHPFSGSKANNVHTPCPDIWASQALLFSGRIERVRYLTYLAPRKLDEQHRCEVHRPKRVNGYLLSGLMSFQSSLYFSRCYHMKEADKAYYFLLLHSLFHHS